MRRRKTVPWTSAIFLVVLVVAAAAAAEKRAMTFLDIVEMRSVGGGSLSPDGKHVLYTVSIPQWKAGRNFTDIFVAAADGSSPPRQMTFTKEKNETQPRWARDSRRFAFLSDRDGANQLFLMRTDGGEARKVSDAKDGVNTFAFSRDGRWLAFSAGRADERQLWLVDLEKEEAPAQPTKHPAPVGAWQWGPDSQRIFFLAPDSVEKDERQRREKKFDVRIADPERPPTHLWSVALADKSTKRWTESKEWSVAQFTLSDDAAWLAFRSASTDRYPQGIDAPGWEIFLVDLRSGAMRQVTKNNDRESAPRFSPDSKWLVYAAADEPAAYLRNTKYYLVPVAGGAGRKLGPDLDAEVGTPYWSADSRTIYFATGIGMDQHWFGVSVADGKLAQLTRERGVTGGSFDDETGMFLLTHSNPAQPGDYYVARPADLGSRARWMRVSNANPQVSGFHLGEYETVRWKSTDGQTVEGILVKPVNYEAGKRYPLIVQVHGGPASAYLNSFSGGYGTYVHIYAANGYAVFQPNYRGSDNYGEKFRRQIAGDYFRQGYDDIITGVDSLIARGIADPAKLGMMGWSAGGHWSNWTLTQTDRFKAISSGAGAVNWISMYAQTDVQAPREFYFQGRPYDNWEHFVAVSPLRYIKNAKTPTLIHVGEADPRVPKPQSDELHMALKKLGVPTEYIVYPNMPHGLTEPRYQMVKMVAEFHWFEKWIKGQPGWFEWKELLATLGESKKEEAKKE
jgi:dipeptidyl aminopeptidase/acylaminoacyl peptidase